MSKKPGKRKRTSAVLQRTAADDPTAAEFQVVRKAEERLVEIEKTGADPNSGFTFRDFSSLELKPDHQNRPIWVTPNGRIYLEATSQIYQQAYDFLVAISEPVARPEFVHEYKLTPYSLYAAMAVSISTDDILTVLGRMCKTQLPTAIVSYIQACTVTYGKAKLVLKDNKFYVESHFPDTLRQLLQDPVIAASRVLDEETGAEFVEGDALQEMKQNMMYKDITVQDDEDEDDPDVLAGTGVGERLKTVSFKLAPEKVRVILKARVTIVGARVQEVKRQCINLDYPLMEEYDFKNDSSLPNLNIDLKPHTRIRIYQEKSLAKMFGNSRARSGIIVLPCGAGKSLTGVTACQTIRKSCAVICINNASVKQWKEQFMLWTTVNEDDIRMFTAESKQLLPPNDRAVILLTTYTMISTTKLSDESEQLMNQISGREWALMVLDEVHVAPARCFQKVLSKIHAHCKLGLTATLVREDNLIADLNFLIGPKLYEANWMDLTQQGYLANVQCVEVWCPMTAEFMDQYLMTRDKREKQLYWCLNPNKLRVCDYLIRYHKARNDKIIIFSDNLLTLMEYCQSYLNIPFIYGKTEESERRKWLTSFKSIGSATDVIGLSKVGDTALDIPEANVIIQVSSHGGSRRQEAQRLGRILRPKSYMSDGFNAFFYTLVSNDTQEMKDSSKRQRYLIDQGYTYKIQQDLVQKAAQDSRILQTKTEELDLLNRAMTSVSQIDKMEQMEDDVDRLLETGLEGPIPAAKRRVTSIAALSGDDSITRYHEYSVERDRAGVNFIHKARRDR